MVDLTTNFCGVSFQNPISTCSGTYGFGIEYGEFLPVERLGSVGTKGLTLHPRKGNPGVRIMETPAGMLNCIGLENPGAKSFVQDILPEMRARLGECKIIANISGDGLESYAEITKILSAEEGIAALEVNISCPNVKAGGMAFGVNCDAASEVCRAVKENTHLPVIMKLSPNVTDIVAIAKALEEAGADALSMINTLLGMSIDIHKQKPMLGNITGGLSGPAVRPVGVRMVYQVAQAVSLPILGMGGIATWEDAIEYFLAGASMISVGAACFRNPNAPFEILEGIERYCEQKNIEKISDLVGLAWKGNHDE